MASFKKLSKSDVTFVPYYANKQWTIASSSYTTYSNIYQGTNVAGLFASSSDPITNGQYERLIYTQINQLFYQSYSGSLNTSSLASSIYYESASQQRPTASYFIYNDSANLIKNFPTGTDEKIQVLSINQEIFGNKILPYSFVLSSSSHYIIDDGYGNLIDINPTSASFYTKESYATSGYFTSSLESTASQYVGNIFYAHGLSIITNQSGSYQYFFPFEEWTVSFKNEYPIYEHEVRCAIKESDFNLSYNPTLIFGSQPRIVSGSDGYILTGSLNGTLKDFATGSNFYTYATTLGLYNDNNELLAVAKFGKPMMMSPDTDMTFVIKYDT
jgi:hypothetical protein